MSTNTLRAHIEFSFKGETHEIESVIDLDRCLAAADEAPNFHLILAKKAGIDTYSYLYEVLESQDIVFSDATGLAAAFCHDGGFDWAGFVRDASSLKDADLRTVRAIALQIMGVADLETRPDLKQALLAAFRAGRG